MRRLVPLLLLALALACSAPARPVSAPAKASPAQRGNAIEAGAAFEVASEEVSFTAGGRTIGGTLALPKAPGAWPAVLLLAGSGPTDRDWNSPLIPTRNGSGALLAAELAKHGAAVLRFDKAGSGKNSGPPIEQWTIDTYRDEAVAALALLRARREVRGDRVFVAGHSEGGIHATRLAQVAQPSLAGVLYLSSASRTMIDTVLTQVEAQPLADLIRTGTASTYNMARPTRYRRGAQGIRSAALHRAPAGPIPRDSLRTRRKLEGTCSFDT